MESNRNRVDDVERLESTRAPWLQHFAWTGHYGLALAEQISVRVDKAGSVTPATKPCKLDPYLLWEAAELASR